MGTELWDLFLLILWTKMQALCNIYSGDMKYLRYYRSWGGRCSISMLTDSAFVYLSHSCRVLLQLWVGVLVSTQSFFINGIDDAESAKTSAFGAMGMFCVTFLLSIYGIYHDANNKADSIEEAPEGYALQGGATTDYGTGRYD